MQDKLRGTGVAIVTPFRKDGGVDFNGLGNLIEHIIKGKADYIVALGTTGETATLTNNEKCAVASHIVESVAKRVPIVLGIGGNNTHEIVQTFHEIDLDGIDAILSVSPYYNKPSQRGIFEHYKMISNACPLPIIIYNVPGRTGSNISVETTLKLANECKNIIAIKEASGNIDQIMQIINHRPKGFLVISGDDALALPVIAAGGDGVISVIANAYPYEMSELTRQALAGNFIEARRLHYSLYDLIIAIFEDGNPCGVKAVLNMLEICNEKARLPLVAVNKHTLNKLGALVKVAV